MQVNGALEELAARQASGILQIDGDPAGTVYFDQGQITCARAAWTPDIGARLLGTLRPPDESLDVLTGADEPDRDIGTFLVQRNYLTIAELAALLRSVVVDTLIPLTALTGEEVYISDIRFAPAGAHWAAAFSCLEVDSVLAEAGRRAAGMTRYRLSRTTPVRLNDLARPSAVLSRRQWALACAIDGAASAQELAWRCGLALYEAIESLGQLIAVGLCLADPAEPEPPSVALPSVAPPSVALPSVAPPSVAPPSMAPPFVALPRRAQPTEPPPPDPTLPTLSAPPVIAAEVSAAAIDGPAPPDLLRRVLEGLRRST